MQPHSNMYNIIMHVCEQFTMHAKHSKTIVDPKLHEDKLVNGLGADGLLSDPAVLRVALLGVEVDNLVVAGLLFKDEKPLTSNGAIAVKQ